MNAPVNASSPASGALPDAHYASFEAQVRDFAEHRCPPSIRAVVAAGGKLHKREYQGWQKILFERGWGAPSWPVAFGGTGWDLRQRLIFERVMAQCDCPPLYHHGLGHIGPVIIRFGTPEQQRRFLPRILDGSDWWCQGYSEPGSGSDLASLRTRAVADGDDYVVNGQKIWTSHAQEADMIYVLVRTSTEARRQDGISLLLVPLASTGITIRPIRTIDGWHHVNEVFFEDVRVPRANLIGEEGRGWACAKYLLECERLPPASVARLSLLWRQVAALLERTIASERETRDTRDLHTLRYALLLAEADLHGAGEMLASATDDLMHQRPLGAKPSALKLLLSDVAQRLVAIAFDAVGPDRAQRFVALNAHTLPIAEPAHDTAADEMSVPADEHDNAAVWVHNYLYYRSKTIAGGTSEVQRNVIARELFGV